MSITAITNATLLDQEGPFAIQLDGAKIESIVDASAVPPGDTVIDADGGLVVPSLVDPHLHLDLAYSVEEVPPNKSGTLLEAIDLWSAAKRELSVDNVKARAIRAVNAEVSFGTGFIRSHVDVAGASGDRLFRGVLAARDETRDRCDIQLVAFPQDGLIRDPGAVDLVRQSVKQGVDLVGGIPHIERTRREGIAHLELMFDLAVELDADIDVHIDETDDPQSLYTEHLASLTIERNYQGRVTASHVCALSSYTDVHAARVMDLIAEAEINVVCNPGVNLHLQGRFDTYPKRRGLTRISQLLQRGVTCAAGQDCIKDPFYPLGTGQMLDQAFLLVHADHLSTPDGIRTAFDMISSMPSAVCNRNATITPGAPTNLTVFPADNVIDLVRTKPTPSAVLFHGRCV